MFSFLLNQLYDQINYTLGFVGLWLFVLSLTSKSLIFFCKFSPSYQREKKQKFQSINEFNDMKSLHQPNRVEWLTVESKVEVFSASKICFPSSSFSMSLSALAAWFCDFSCCRCSRSSLLFSNAFWIFSSFSRYSSFDIKSNSSSTCFGFNFMFSFPIVSKIYVNENDKNINNGHLISDLHIE